MKGTVYFEDGHTEEIGLLLKHSEHHIEFSTKSGFYEYMSFTAKTDFCEYKTHRFYKRILTGVSYMFDGSVEAEWGHIVVPEIVKIEIPE